jgi:hypothetical protein
VERSGGGHGHGGASRRQGLMYFEKATSLLVNETAAAASSSIPSEVGWTPGLFSTHFVAFDFIERSHGVDL